MEEFQIALIMKIGFVMVFQEYPEDIDPSFFIKNFKKLRSVELCVVNNSCHDKTAALLVQISNSCDHVSLVNIKKVQNEKSSVKAGARFLWNTFGIEQICFYITEGVDKSEDVKWVISEMVSKQDNLMAYFSTLFEISPSKRTLYRNSIPIHDFLKNDSTTTLL